MQTVNWVPLDVIGQTYTDWVLSRDELPQLVNFVHPKGTPWDVVLDGINGELVEPISQVTLQAWAHQVENLSVQADAPDIVRTVSIFA